METTSEQEQVDFNIRQTSAEEAEEAVSTSGAGRTSQYESVAQAWEDADEAIVLEGVTKNDVQNIRNLIYRRYNKEDVIVRSAKKGDDNFNVSIRERKDGEYLRDDDGGADEEKAEVVPEDDTSAEDTSEDEGSDEGFEPSFD